MIPNASERNRGSLGWPLAQGFVAAGGNQNRQLFKGTAGSAALVLLLAPALSLRAANQSEQPSPGLEEKGAELSSKRLELRGMENTLELSEEQRRKIQAEIATIRADRAKLVAALLDATKTVSETESQISETEARLDTLTSSANAIKRSLEARGRSSPRSSQPCNGWGAARRPRSLPRPKTCFRLSELRCFSARCCPTCVARWRPLRLTSQTLSGYGSPSRRNARALPQAWPS